MFWFILDCESVAVGKRGGEVEVKVGGEGGRIVEREGGVEGVVSLVDCGRQSEATPMEVAVAAGGGR